VSPSVLEILSLPLFEASLRLFPAFFLSHPSFCPSKSRPLIFLLASSMNPLFQFCCMCVAPFFADAGRGSLCPCPSVPHSWNSKFPFFLDLQELSLMALAALFFPLIHPLTVSPACASFSLSPVPVSGCEFVSLPPFPALTVLNPVDAGGVSCVFPHSCCASVVCLRCIRLIFFFVQESSDSFHRDRDAPTLVQAKFFFCQTTRFTTSSGPLSSAGFLWLHPAFLHAGVSGVSLGSLQGFMRLLPK